MSFSPLLSRSALVLHHNQTKQRQFSCKLDAKRRHDKSFGKTHSAKIQLLVSTQVLLVWLVLCVSVVSVFFIGCIFLWRLWAKMPLVMS